MKKITNLFNVSFKRTNEAPEPLTISTPLGKVILDITFNKIKSDMTKKLSELSIEEKGIISNNAYIYIWNCKDFHFELLKVTLKPSLPPGMHVDYCVAFLCRLKCFSDIQSQFTCRLKFHEKLEGEPESGEGFIAQSWQDTKTKLTIGTEDEDYLLSRAVHEKGLPRRFVLKESTTFDMIDYLKDGLSLSLPFLFENEEGQVQFILAWSKKDGVNPSSTWFAIDQRPEEILKQAGNL
ncbi:MAG: hypothetical protein L0207_00615 [Chlamydiae bacterium]|nr:hypothetical protein [Chlamydiota bacterium]